MSNFIDLTKEETSFRNLGIKNAFEIVAKAAEFLGTKKLVKITSAHTDSCLYFGESGLMFAKKLSELGAEVAVPTSMNVGSLDLLHPELIQSKRDTKIKAQQLLNYYEGFGCEAIYSCAPYQISNRPEKGDFCAWGESNAISFINSVLGAKSNRCGDFMDICCAIAGYAPYYGLLIDENRKPNIILSLNKISKSLQNQKIFYPLLGAVIGRVSQNQIPIVIDHYLKFNEDSLKSLGAAAASTGDIGLYHIDNVTPEADKYSHLIHQLPVIEITDEMMLDEWKFLGNGKSGDKIDCIALGSPHFSYDEFCEVYQLLPNKKFTIPFYICTSRFVYNLLTEQNMLQKFQKCGVTIVTDTCIVVTPILKNIKGTLMTNSGKFANYSLPNTGYKSVFGSLLDCIKTAMTGKLVCDDLSL